MAARGRRCQAGCPAPDPPGCLTVAAQGGMSVLTMSSISPALRLIAAVLVAVWIGATLVALLGGRRRGGAPPDADVALPPEFPGPRAVTPLVDLSPAVFNLSSLPIWWVDRDLRLAGANDAFARAVGYPTAAGAVRANADLATGTRRLAAQARAADRAFVGEERVLIAGERRLLEVIAIPLSGGEVLHFALDETQRHAAYTAANARARALADMLDSLDTATALFDAGGALDHYNRVFAEIFAQDGAWLATRPDFDRVLDALRAAQRLPEVSDFAAWRTERRGWFDTPEIDAHAEDWMLPGGTLIHVIAQPHDGGLLMLFEDRTERARLTASHDRLCGKSAAVLDNLSEGVAIFGPDGRLKLHNRRFAEIVVAPPDLLVADLPAERLIAHIADYLDEPARAQDLRAMILSATAGRVARGGSVMSTLGYVVEFAATPLPDGDALLTISAAAVGAGAVPAR